MGRTKTTLIFLILDAISVNLAYFGALVLRFDGAVPPQYLQTWLYLAPGITVVTLATYLFSGLYKKLWYYASVREMYEILRGVTLASLLVVVGAYVLIYPTGSFNPLPRSVYLLAWLLNLIFTGGSRFSLRSLREFRRAPAPSLQKVGNPGQNKPDSAGSERGKKNRRRALIVGAGDAGAMVARELENHPSLGLEPVGFIDDDQRKHGLYLLELPVLGGREDIPRIASEWQIEEIIIAMPSAPGRVIREIVEICKQTGARLKTLPGVYELIDGRVRVSQLRDVQVEDLLGREPVQLDLEEIAAYITGKTVLVTGAGGSIGSELCRQAARFRPARLVLVDNSENNLFEIEQELRERFSGLDVQAELADVRDRERLRRIFEAFRPEVVFHAAAHKHVPLMERCPEQAVSNNIWGTYVIAAEAQRVRTQVFILVSTDKAVRPRSVMGATKRAAELLVQYLNEKSREEGLPTRFAAVRFGNVLGSRGSVLPIFKRQIAQGGPVTVTHPEMVRYFMTIPEAVQLIIQAGALAEGGEIFVLDMGEPVKIVDLARDLIRLSGLEPDRDIEIRFTGIRPGEKLKEELFTPEEKKAATKNKRIFVAKSSTSKRDLEIAAALVEKIEAGEGLKDHDEALALLSWLFPEWLEERTEKDAPLSLRGPAVLQPSWRSAQRL